MVDRRVKALGRLLQPEIESVTLTRGVVVAAYGTESNQNDAWTVDVQIQGSIVTTPNVGYMATYAPTIGDVVWVVMSDGEPWVLGKMCVGDAGNFPAANLGYEITTLNTAVPAGGGAPTVGVTYYAADPVITTIVTPGRQYRCDFNGEIYNPAAGTATVLNAFIYANHSRFGPSKMGILARGLALPALGVVQISGFGLYNCPQNSIDGDSITFQLGMLNNGFAGGKMEVFGADNPGCTLLQVFDMGPW